MRRVNKVIGIVLVFALLSTCTAFADNKVENNPTAEIESSAEVEINQSETADKIVDKLETLLDPENDELEKEVTETLEKPTIPACVLERIKED